MEVRPLEPGGPRRLFVAERLRVAWAGSVARRGELIDPSDLPGVIALEQEAPIGYALYQVADDACEVVVIETLRRRSGVGSALIDAVVGAAGAAGSSMVWLVTTNDNLDAIAFYESKGFVLEAVRAGAVDDARNRLKPGIPQRGESGIAIRDELEYRLDLSRG